MTHCAMIKSFRRGEVNTNASALESAGLSINVISKEHLLPRSCTFQVSKSGG